MVRNEKMTEIPNRNILHDGRMQKCLKRSSHQFICGCCSVHSLLQRTIFQRISSPRSHVMRYIGRSLHALHALCHTNASHINQFGQCKLNKNEIERRKMRRGKMKMERPPKQPTSGQILMHRYRCLICQKWPSEEEERD